MIISNVLFSDLWQAIELSIRSIQLKNERKNALKIIILKFRKASSPMLQEWHQKSFDRRARAYHERDTMMKTCFFCMSLCEISYAMT